MVISRGTTKRIPVMKEAHQLFEIGVPFWYTPIADPSTTILIQAADTKELFCEHFGSEQCDVYCACAKWCSQDDNGDADGNNYIPACGYPYRDNQVYFKKI